MNWLQKYRSDFRTNLTLALPVIGGQVGQITVNVADNLMVGKLGAKPLAAVSLGVAVFVIFMVVGMGISFALPPLVAEADGQNNRKLVSEDFKHSLVVNIVFAILAIGFIELFMPLMYHMKQDPEVVGLTIPYLRLNAYSLLPLMFFQTFRCYADGLSKTWIPMVAMLTANVFNILGLIYFRKELWAYIKAIDLGHYRSALFGKILILGVPTSLQMFFEVSAFAGAAFLMGMISPTAQAAHQIAINLASISFLICTGMAITATIRVGNQLGRKDYPALQSAGLSAFIQVTAFMCITAIIFVIGRYFFPTLYIKDEAVISIAATLLLYAAIFQLSDGIQVVAIGALRGMQDVIIPTIITFIAYWLFGIPLSYFLAFHFNLGPSGVWIGLVAGLTISALLNGWRFWKKSEQLKL